MSKLRNAVFGAFLMALAVVTAACSSSTTSSGGGSCGGVGSSGTQGVVDMAVGDDEQDAVLVFLDILSASDTGGAGSAGMPAASAILDNAGSGISNPYSMALTQDDLYVGNNGTNEILIFRDFASLANGDAADVALNNGTAGIDNPVFLIADTTSGGNDRLIVANQGNDTVGIFEGASAITVNQAPDVVLNNGGSLIDSPRMVAIADDDLYVANSANTAGNPLVAIFRDIDTVTSGDAPDVNLSEDVSFFDTGIAAESVAVHDNVLYVGSDDTDSVGQVYVFQDADALTSDALPDAILFGNAAYIDSPASMAVIDGNTDTLLVASQNFDVGVCTDAPGISGFADTANLFTGQEADVVLPQATSSIGRAAHLSLAGGALFVVGGRENCDFYPNDVMIFRNVQSGGLCSTSQPNIILAGHGLQNGTPFGELVSAAIDFNANGGGVGFAVVEQDQDLGT